MFSSLGRRGLSSRLLFGDRLFVLILCWTMDFAVGSRQSHYIHWNTSNPIFRIDNTDHIIDVNQGNQPWEYDQVNIICPLYRPEEGHLAERYIIYSVSKEEYESCRIMSTNPRVIAQCTQPHQLMYFTLTFRSFTPTPGGMEFKPGRNYYFISTSSHEDVERRVGGRCSTHNMKVQFKVADNQHESPPPSSSLSSSPSHHNRHVNARRRPLPPTSTPSTSTTATTTTERSNRNPFAYEKLPRYYGDLSYYPVYDGDVDGGGGGDQRIDIRLQHDEDVVKHEASRMASAAAASADAGMRATSPLLLLLLIGAVSAALRKNAV